MTAASDPSSNQLYISKALAVINQLTAKLIFEPISSLIADSVALASKMPSKLDSAAEAEAKYQALDQNELLARQQKFSNMAKYFRDYGYFSKRREQQLKQ